MTEYPEEMLPEVVAKLAERVDFLEKEVKAQNARIEQIVKQDTKTNPVHTKSTLPPSPGIPPRPAIPRETITSKHSWKAEHLETRIGGTWLNRIGVVAFVLGMAFFLKYAFENNWIGPTGRVALGIIIGLGLLTGGDFAQKKKYEKFAQGITGGGIAVLYLSFFAAFSFYHLLPQIPAFILMIMVTTTAVLLAVRYNAMSIAVLGVLGGFLTPFLLSTGEVNTWGLFSYIAILDLGILGAAYFKNWRPLNYLSFFLTQIVILAWLFNTSAQEIWTRELVLTLFFVIFALLSFLYNIIHRSKTESADLVLILFNAGSYFLLSYQNLEAEYKAFLGLFACLMALIYFSLGYLALKINQEDKNLTLTFLGVSLVFLTIAIPVQLSGHWITIGWATEGAVLVWLGFRTKSIKTRYGAWLVLGLVALRLFGYDNDATLQNYYYYSGNLQALQPYLPFWNARTGTFVVGITAFFLSAYLYLLNKPDLAIEERSTPGILGVVANLLILWLLSTEINNYFNYQQYVLNYRNAGHGWELQEAKQLTLSAVWTFYSILLIVLGFIKKSKPVRLFAIILFGITILKVFLYDLAQLDTIYRILSFIILGVILMLVSFLYQKYKEQITDLME